MAVTVTAAQSSRTKMQLCLLFLRGNLDYILCSAYLATEKRPDERANNFVQPWRLVLYIRLAELPWHEKRANRPDSLLWPKKKVELHV
jgi:hypothetical protein